MMVNSLDVFLDLSLVVQLEDWKNLSWLIRYNNIMIILRVYIQCMCNLIDKV